MNKNLEKFNFDLIKNNTRVGVALSGGVDSVCCFLALCEVREEKNIEVVALSLNHSLRDCAEEEIEFCRELANKYNAKFITKRVDVMSHCQENAISIEMGARKLRYEFFEQVLKSGEVDCVALGHHQKDRVESVMLNLFKGTSLKGMTTMKEVRGGFVRPMRDMTKSQIEGYVKDLGESFVVDKSNKDTTFERNFIREEILPKISQRFNKAENNIINFCNKAEIDDEFLYKLAKECVKFEGNAPYIEVKDLSEMAIASRAVMYALECVNVFADVYNKNILNVINLKSSQSGKKITLPQSVEASREYDRVYFKKIECERQEKPSILFKIGKFEVLGKEIEIKFENNFKKTRNKLFFDFDKIKECAKIRTREDGDFIQRSCGKVLLSDFFSDKKIEKSQRDKALILAQGNQVIAVLGQEVSTSCYVTEKTKRIVSITMSEEEQK